MCCLFSWEGARWKPADTRRLSHHLGARSAEPQYQCGRLPRGLLTLCLHPQKTNCANTAPAAAIQFGMTFFFSPPFVVTKEAGYAICYIITTELEGIDGAKS